MPRYPDVLVRPARRAPRVLLTAGAALAIGGCGGGASTAAGSGASPVRVPAGAGTTKSAAVGGGPRRSLDVPVTGIPVNRWQARPPALLSRSEVSAARIGRMAYVVGGFASDLRATAAVERVDLRTGRWTKSAPLPQPLNHMNAVAYGGALYVVGGYTGSSDTSTGASRAFWRFVPGGRRWQRMPDAPLARAAAGAAVVGHRLYVAGGRSDTRPTLASVEIFDFQDGRWTAGPPLRRAREHVAAVATAGAVWLLGGRAAGQGFSDVERLASGARAWRQMPPMPLARSSFQAVFAKGRIVVAGGEDASTTFSEVDTLSPSGRAWHRSVPLPAPRHGFGLVAAGPLVWVIEGGPRAGLTTSDSVQRIRIGQ